MSEITEFYDELSENYHLIYADWDEAVEQQGAALGRLIRDILGPGPKRILDVACGIGTQALGLACRGHEVTGTDLSPGAVARARAEAERLGVALSAEVADLRNLPDALAGPFDVVCALDNALPHLEGEAELPAIAAQDRTVFHTGCSENRADLHARADEGRCLHEVDLSHEV